MKNLKKNLIFFKNYFGRKWCGAECGTVVVRVADAGQAGQSAGYAGGAIHRALAVAAAQQRGRIRIHSRYGRRSPGSR